MSYHIELCDVFSAIIPCLTIGLMTIVCAYEGYHFLKSHGYIKSSRVVMTIAICALGLALCQYCIKKEFNRRVYAVGLQYEQSGEYISAHDTYKQIYTGYAEAAKALERIQQEYDYQLAAEKYENGELEETMRLYLGIPGYGNSEFLFKKVVYDYFDIEEPSKESTKIDTHDAPNDWYLFQLDDLGRSEP